MSDGEEMMMASFLPRRRRKIGPYVAARRVKKQWRSASRKGRFPTRGSPEGPGGRAGRGTDEMRRGRSRKTVMQKRMMVANAVTKVEILPIFRLEVSIAVCLAE